MKLTLMLKKSILTLSLVLFTMSSSLFAQYVQIEDTQFAIDSMGNWTEHTDEELNGDQSGTVLIAWMGTVSIDLSIGDGGSIEMYSYLLGEENAGLNADVYLNGAVVDSIPMGTGDGTDQANVMVWDTTALPRGDYKLMVYGNSSIDYIRVTGLLSSEAEIISTSIGTLEADSPYDRIIGIPAATTAGTLLGALVISDQASAEIIEGTDTIDAATTLTGSMQVQVVSEDTNTFMYYNLYLDTDYTPVWSIVEAESDAFAGGNATGDGDYTNEKTEYPVSGGNLREQWWGDISLDFHVNSALANNPFTNNHLQLWGFSLEWFAEMNPDLPGAWIIFDGDSTWLDYSDSETWGLIPILDTADFDDGWHKLTISVAHGGVTLLDMAKITNYLLPDKELISTTIGTHQSDLKRVRDIPDATTVSEMLAALTISDYAIASILDTINGTEITNGATQLAAKNVISIMAQDSSKAETEIKLVSELSAGDSIVSTAIGTLENDTIFNILSVTTVGQLRTGIVVALDATFEIQDSLGVAMTDGETVEEKMVVIVTAENGNTRTYRTTINYVTFITEYAENFDGASIDTNIWQKGPGYWTWTHQDMGLLTNVEQSAFAISKTLTFDTMAFDMTEREDRMLTFQFKFDGGLPQLADDGTTEWEDVDSVELHIIPVNNSLYPLENAEDYDYQYYHSGQFWMNYDTNNWQTVVFDFREDHPGIGDLPASLVDWSNIDMFMLQYVVWTTGPRMVRANYFMDDFRVGAAVDRSQLTKLGVSNGIFLNYFDPDTLMYEVELPSGTTVHPVISAEAIDGTIDIVNATDINGEGDETVATVTVTGTDENVSTYKVDFIVKDTADDASLKSLTVELDGTSYDLTPEFNPTIMDYSIVLPKTTTATPTVTGVTNVTSATVVQVNAPDIKSSDAVERTTTLTVTSSNGNFQSVYTVLFDVTPNDDATLSSLTLSDGALNPAFDTDSLIYTVDVDENTTVEDLPEITAVATDSYATVTLLPASAFGPDVPAAQRTARVKVVAEDNNAQLIYAIEFVPVKSQSISSYNNGVFSVHPNPADTYIKLSNSDKLATVKIYNSAGSLVKAVENPQNTILVDDLSNGLYIINLVTKDGQAHSMQFIVE